MERYLTMINTKTKINYSTTHNYKYKRFHNQYFQQFQDKFYRIIALHGGRASGKSYAAAQYIILQSLKNPGFRAVMCRKGREDVKGSCYQQIEQTLDDMNVPITSYQARPGINVFRFANGSVIEPRGYQDVLKTKSKTNSDLVWFEEADQFTEDDFRETMVSLRKEKAQIILTSNPFPINSPGKQWLYKLIFSKQKEGDPNKLVIKSTFKDAADRLTTDTVKEILSYKDGDPERWAMWGLGNYILAQGVVFREKIHWFTYFDHEVQDKLELLCYGLDFGAMSPHAIVALYAHKDYLDRYRMPTTFYIKEMVYVKGSDVPDISTLAEIMSKKKVYIDKPIYCDYASPDKIAILKSSGYTNARQCEAKRFKDITIHGKVTLKSDDWINGTNDLMKAHKLYIERSSYHLINELRSYSYTKQKRNSPELMSQTEYVDRPEDANNHAIDAMRYAIHSYLKRTGLTAKTLAGLNTL